jgi:hypothetical protein
MLTFVSRVYAADGYVQSPTYKLIVAKCVGGHYVASESAEALWDAVVALVEIHQGINGVLVYIVSFGNLQRDTASL